MLEGDPNQRDDVPFPSQFGGRNPAVPLHTNGQFGFVQPQQAQSSQLQQAAQILANAGYQVSQSAAPQMPANSGGAYSQPAQFEPAAESDMSAQVAKQRLAMLKAGFSCGLGDVCEFMLDGIASYQSQYHQATGQPLGFEEALSHVIAGLNCVTT